MQITLSEMCFRKITKYSPVLIPDALSLERNLDRDEIPKNAWNPNLLLKSYKELMKIKKSGFTIVCGHDDTQWKNKLKMGITYK